MKKAHNIFAKHLGKIANDKPKNGVRLQKTEYLQSYKGCKFTVTIERGDRLNRRNHNA